MSRHPESESGELITDRRDGRTGPRARARPRRSASADGASPRSKRLEQARAGHVDAVLDAALDATFPASDPVSISRFDD